jgi:hypothetical protein
MDKKKPNVAKVLFSGFEQLQSVKMTKNFEKSKPH